MKLTSLALPLVTAFTTLSSPFAQAAGKAVSIRVTRDESQIIHVDECGGPITIEFLDAAGNPTVLDKPVTIMSYNLHDAKLYGDDACGTSGLRQKLTIQAGTKSKIVYFKDSYPQNITLDIKDLSGGLTNNILEFDVMRPGESEVTPESPYGN